MKELKKIFQNIRIITIIKFRVSLKKYGANNISRAQNTQEDFL